MIKRFSAALFMLLLIACNRQPYVEHKVGLEKKAENCIGVLPSFKLNSNFGGERYEFEKCLPANYDESMLVAERHGDTVLVRFPLPNGPYQQVLYQVTLDIDSYPRYSFLTIDDDTYLIGASGK